MIFRFWDSLKLFRYQIPMNSIYGPTDCAFISSYKNQCTLNGFYRDREK